MRPRVFVVQERLRRGVDGSLTPVHDLTPAVEYGDLVVVLRHGSLSIDPQPTLKQIEEVLEDFTENDYLLLVGDPTAIGMASTVAAEQSGGRVNMLKWERAVNRYIPVTVDFGRHQNVRY